jgi:hypothetical protein
MESKTNISIKKTLFKSLEENDEEIFDKCVGGFMKHSPKKFFKLHFPHIMEFIISRGKRNLLKILLDHEIDISLYYVKLAIVYGNIDMANMILQIGNFSTDEIDECVQSGEKIKSQIDDSFLNSKQTYLIILCLTIVEICVLYIIWGL